MKKQKHDIAKVKQALFWKEISECVPVIGGGTALIILAYPVWGTLCVLAGAFGIFAKLLNKSPLSFAKLLLEMVALIGGCITLVSLGQVSGGAACIVACAVRVATEMFVMPFVERRYLA
jgi:hypothetical protein